MRSKRSDRRTDAGNAGMHVRHNQVHVIFRHHCESIDDTATTVRRAHAFSRMRNAARGKSISGTLLTRPAGRAVKRTIANRVRYERVPSATPPKSLFACVEFRQRQNSALTYLPPWISLTLTGSTTSD